MSQCFWFQSSGISTLNMWSFCLGRMPVIWPSDADRLGLEKTGPDLQFVQSGEEQIAEAALSAVRARTARLD